MSAEAGRVLVVDDDPMLRDLLNDLLTGNGYQVVLAVNGKEALASLESQPFDHVITDINMPEMDGLALLEAMQTSGLQVPVTVISAYSDMDNVVRAFRLGASDFIAKPFQAEEEVLLTLKKVAEKHQLERDNSRLREELRDRYVFSNIVAKSRGMTDIFATIGKIADYHTTVLLTGESGTGKELITRAIHYNSIRKDRPLVSINCGGIPENLLESELFGHAKGAFTDAHRARKGLFEEANGGTLFLDEIAELPLNLQVKLLRAIQEEEIRPLGDSRSIKLDVRIIAATARTLKDEVAAGRFREDLYYRINVLPIMVPPLRERKEDIPLLVEHFLKKYNQRMGLQVARLDSGCLQRMLVYDWPGNVRELENVVERAMALANGPTLTEQDLPPELIDSATAAGG
ncbi:MAG: sigma-54 dependent transcriptional regulator, partial [Desulfobulbaceae bacterium]|nr:sigma-54 dependent transcriptional regulator [Desulfobulbaceae bacterium]